MRIASAARKMVVSSFVGNGSGRMKGVGLGLLFGVAGGLGDRDQGWACWR